ncbi:MAG: hypothetical protein GY904_33260, partial [Planctomycetaceae bacterium]|nr:hypothetical protein [Planctomycetaceae bacterium]
ADNTSAVDATALSSTQTGDTAVGVVLAFNTIGWEQQNTLFNAVDALLGNSHFGTEDPAEVIAAVENSTVDATGDLTVAANNQAKLNATVSNAATSEASALFGASGMSASGVLSSNKVSTDTRAYVNAQAVVTVGGNVLVDADDQAGIYANSKIVSSSTTTNDGGASVIQETLNDLQDVNHTSDETSVFLQFGDRVRLSDTYAVADFDTAFDFGSNSNVESLVSGTTLVGTEDNYAVADYSTDGTTRRVNLSSGSFVEIGTDFTTNTTSGLGTAGQVYRFTGSDLDGLSLNLGEENYNDSTRWAAVAGKASTIYKYIGSADESRDLSTQDFTSSDWLEIAGNAGSIYEYLGNDGIDPATGSTGTTDLSIADYTNLDFWKEVSETQTLPQGLNITGSDSIAVGGVVVYNDVRANAHATIDDATVNTTDGDVTVTATGEATIIAFVDSTASSSGGSAYGTGTSLAINGTIATNLVLGTTEAVIRGSTIKSGDANDSDSNSLGNVSVLGRNNSTIEAVNASNTTTGDTGVGVTLAFNTVGWDPENVLFNTIDAIIGDPTNSAAYSGSNPVSTVAAIENSSVNADGSITIESRNIASIQSDVSNETTSAASALFGASGMAIGAIISLNKVNGSTKAYISNSSNIIADDGLTIHGDDVATINADHTLKALSTTTNDGGSSILAGYIESANNEYQYTTKSGTREVNQGELVYLASDFSLGSNSPGDVYTYQGTSPLSVDLGTVDYAASSLWKKVDPLALLDWVPDVLNLNASSSNAMAIGGLIVLNDVRGSVESYIATSTVNIGDTIDIHAQERAIIDARNESVSAADGGSAFVGGSTVAVNAVIVTNVVLSDANAYVDASTLTTTNSGDVLVDASNTSAINAITDNETTVKGGGTSVSVGVTAAFNSIGMRPQNLLFNVADTFSDSVIANHNPAETRAFIRNSAIDAAGGIRVTTNSDATIEAKVQNSAVSTSLTLASSTSVSVGAIIALNRVSTDVDAFIDNTDDSANVHAAAGDIVVQATDNASIDSEVAVTSFSLSASMTSSAGVALGMAVARNEITNDLDAHITNVNEVSSTNGSIVVTADAAATIETTTSASSVAVGASVSSGKGFSGAGAVALNSIRGGTNAYISGSNVTATSSGAVGFEYTSGHGDVELINGDRVRLDSDYSGTSGTPGEIYRYTGSTSKTDLSDQNYAGSSWTRVSSEGNVIVEADNRSVISTLIDSKSIAAAGGLSSSVAGSLGVSVAQNFIGFEGSLNLDSLGGSRTRTPVETHAYIMNSDVRAAGSIDVSADASATVNATVTAISAAVGLSAGSSVSLSGAGVYTENRIGTSTLAFVNGVKGDGSSGVPSGIQTQGGAISIRSQDVSQIAADAAAASVGASLAGSTGVGVSVGLTLAFNEVDNDIDAYIKDVSSVSSAGDIRIDAHAPAGDVDPPDYETSDGTRVLSVGDTIRLDETYLNGGQGGRIYKYRGFVPDYTLEDGAGFTGDLLIRDGNTVAKNGKVYRYLAVNPDNAEREIDLSTINFETNSDWTVFNGDSRNLGSQDYSDTRLWELADGTITARAAAASISAAFGATAGVAISGAGANSVNTVLTRTNAFIDDSTVTSATDVNLNASKRSIITAQVGAVSVALGGGGAAGVGASIGVSVVSNL